MALTDAACRAAKGQSKLYKISDGGGLQLWVHPTGSRTWRLAYRFDGAQKNMTLGTYPDMKLVDGICALREIGTRGDIDLSAFKVRRRS